MKPNFALKISDENLSLLHRTARGWLEIGVADFASPDLEEALGYLRRSALGLAPHGISTKLVIPNSQILYTEVEAPGPDAAHRKKQIRRALARGLHPMRSMTLVFDWRGTGARVQVAVVAKETLSEAEAFANNHRLNPISFVAIPDQGKFAGEPWFGASELAPTLLPEGEKVERDQDPITVVGRDTPRQETAAKATAEADDAPKSKAKAPEEAKAQKVAPKSEPEAAPPKAAPEPEAVKAQPEPAKPKAEAETAPAKAKADAPKVQLRVTPCNCRSGSRSQSDARTSRSPKASEKREAKPEPDVKPAPEAKPVSPAPEVQETKPVQEPKPVQEAKPEPKSEPDSEPKAHVVDLIAGPAAEAALAASVPDATVPEGATTPPTTPEPTPAPAFNTRRQAGAAAQTAEPATSRMNGRFEPRLTTPAASGDATQPPASTPARPCFGPRCFRHKGDNFCQTGTCRARVGNSTCASRHRCPASLWCIGTRHPRSCTAPRQAHGPGGRPASKAGSKDKNDSCPPC